MTDLRTAAQAVIDVYYSGCGFSAHIINEFVGAMDSLRQALAAPVEPDKRIVELEQLVKAQQKAFDIESNRITFAQHKSLHKMLISDAIKKMKDCQGRPYSAWDMWLIDAKCMLERVLREWPAPQEVTLTTPPSVDALIGVDDWIEAKPILFPTTEKLIAEAVAKEREECAQIAMDFWCDAGAEAIRARGQK